MQVDHPRRVSPSYDAWCVFLARSAAALAALLLGAGLVCLVAANWPGMGKWQRFGLAQGLLVLLAAAAIRCERGRAGARAQAALLGLAGVALGALLALLGQTYQSGADAWELFAWWAALLLPWALAAGSAAVWLLWVLVANVAACFWLKDIAVLDWLPGAGVPLLGVAQAGLNALLLVLWEAVARRRGHPGRSGPRLLALLVLAALVPAVVLADLDRRGVPAVAAWAAATAALLWAYRRRPADLVILSMAAAGVIAVSLRLAGEFLFSAMSGEAALLPLAALLLAQSAWAARWLRSVAAQAAVRPPAPPAQACGPAAGPRSGAGDPWHVQLLLAFGAWLATLLLLVFLAAADVVATPQGALAVGLALMAAAVPAVRRTGGFLRQMGVAAGLAGLALAGYAALELLPGGPVAWAAWLALAAALYVLAPDPVLRLLCGLAMAVGVAGLLNGAPDAQGWEALGRALDGRGPGGGPLWTVVLLAAVAASVFATGGRRSVAARPLAWAWAAAAQFLAWLAQGVVPWQWPALAAQDPIPASALAVAAALPAAAAAWVLRARHGPPLPRALRLGLPAAMLALALCWLPAPGVALALAWLLLGHAARSRRLAAFGVLALLVYLWRYYYQQQVPLLDKGLWLCAAGLAMGGLYAAVRLLRRPARSGPPSAASPVPVTPPGPAASPGPAAACEPAASPASAGLAAAPPGDRRRQVLVAGGLLLSLGFANAVAAWRERILAHGRSVVLELAPVDPRALMLGDYMALDFAVARQAGREAGTGRAGYVVVRPDAAGVAHMVRIQPALSPLAQDEIALRYRRHGRNVRVATNAYFFAEGQAGRYAGARYGLLRVDRSGRAVLAGLLDEAQRPL